LVRICEQYLTKLAHELSVKLDAQATDQLGGDLAKTVRFSRGSHAFKPHANLEQTQRMLGLYVVLERATTQHNVTQAIAISEPVELGDGTELASLYVW